MKKLFIVFEGADGSGKTSLAKEIAKTFKVGYTHNDKCYNYNDGLMKSYNYINELEEMDSCVIDRLVHTGEGIYAPIYRGYDGSNYFANLEEKMMEKFDMLIVYVQADDEVIEKRLEERGEDYINFEDIKKIKENYINYLQNTKIPHIIYTNNKEGIEYSAHKLSLLILGAVGKHFANNK